MYLSRVASVRDHLRLKPRQITQQQGYKAMGV